MQKKRPTPAQEIRIKHMRLRAEEAAENGLPTVYVSFAEWDYLEQERNRLRRRLRQAENVARPAATKEPRNE